MKKEATIGPNLSKPNNNQSVELLNVNFKVDKELIWKKQIQFNEMLGDIQKQDIVCLLNKYRDCFALNLKDIACTNLKTMNSQETANSKPLCSCLYKTNASEHNIIKERLW